jgi:hypothetical protein
VILIGAQFIVVPLFCLVLCLLSTLSTICVLGLYTVHVHLVDFRIMLRLHRDGLRISYKTLHIKFINTPIVNKVFELLIV